MQETILNFFKQHAAELIWILILFSLGKLVLRFIIKHFIQLTDDGDDSFTSQKEKRSITLGHIINSIGNTVIYLIVLFMVLNVFGIDISPILASVGILGLAIGFGAQSIVKDFVSGLFIIIENQYGIGDRVKIGSFEGEVIKITMRSTVLMDDEKRVYYISNGLIKDVINMSQKQKS